MCVTAFLRSKAISWLIMRDLVRRFYFSMWISNTATTAMMVPIAESVIDQLRRSRNNNQHKLKDDVIPPNREVALRLIRAEENGHVEHEEE